MSASALTTTAPLPDVQAIQAALLSGDINKLGPDGKVDYYLRVCNSLGLNPLTQPFEFIVLSGKMRFYATKACTEQLRKINGVALTIESREEVAGCYVVTARAVDKWGRTDESLGAVPIEGKKGEERSNAMMKAETKAKRRVTLSICGLGLLDESEADSIPGAVRVPAEAIAKAAARVGTVDAEVTAGPKEGPAAVHAENADLSTAGAASFARAAEAAVSPAHAPISSNDTGEAPSEAELAAVRDAARSLQWAPPRAGAWMQKHFGVALKSATKDQAAAALTLLLSLASSEAAYQSVLSKMVAEGRALA